MWMSLKRINHRSVPRTRISFTMSTRLLPADIFALKSLATKLRKGYVFTGVWQSVQGVSLVPGAFLVPSPMSFPGWGGTLHGLVRGSLNCLLFMLQLVLRLRA